MPVTPLDIVRRIEDGFSLQRRGFDPEQVKAFLDEVRETLEQTLREKRQLTEDLKERERELEWMRAEQGEIKDTLLLAKRFSDELETGARREADLVVGEARLEAQRIISATHDEHHLLTQEVHQLRALRHKLLAELDAVLVAHRRLLDDMTRDHDGAG